MIGYTDREGMLFDIMAERIGIKKYSGAFEKFIPNHINVKEGSDESKVIANSIKDFYFNGSEPSEENMDNTYLVSTL